MQDEFLRYLLNDLREHVGQLEEIALNYDTDGTDGERLQYHKDKATSIVNLIEQKIFPKKEG